MCDDGQSRCGNLLCVCRNLLKSEQIRDLGQVSENGVAQIQEIRIGLADLLGQLLLQILGLPGNKGPGCGFGKVVELDTALDRWATVASHIGLYERINIQIQRSRQVIGCLVTSKLLGLPVVELDLVANGQQVSHNVSPRSLVLTGFPGRGKERHLFTH
jgi:hypothetical protein